MGNHIQYSLLAVRPKPLSTKTRTWKFPPCYSWKKKYGQTKILDTKEFCKMIRKPPAPGTKPLAVERAGRLRSVNDQHYRIDQLSWLGGGPMLDKSTASSTVPAPSTFPAPAAAPQKAFPMAIGGFPVKIDEDHNLATKDYAGVPTKSLPCVKALVHTTRWNIACYKPVFYCFSLYWRPSWARRTPP